MRAPYLPSILQAWSRGKLCPEKASPMLAMYVVTSAMGAVAFPNF
jgi:hypothetical protein